MRKRTVQFQLILWVVLLAAVTAAAVFPRNRAAAPAQAAPTHTPVSIDPTTEPAEKSSDLYGVWVPYFSLTGESRTEEAFRENFLQIIETACNNGMNALFVHVRPFCDSLYPSQLFPWSHLLTGEQGKDPSWDPLTYMIETAHEAGLAFHAWVNPLRIKTAESTFALSADNIYTQLSEANPYYFMEWQGGIYLNPAYPYVRTLIAKGVGEICENYDVDGIHFDDYFYPATDSSLDTDAYALYAESVTQPLSLLDWRTANVNALIQEVYQTVKSIDETILFGISPQGNLENDTAMGADVATWCAVSGYVDYLCPQLYYSFESDTLDFTTALSQWSALPKHESLQLYVGLALYKAGTDSDNGTWLDDTEILLRQSQQAQAAQCSGIILYSIDSFANESSAQAAVALAQ